MEFCKQCGKLLPMKNEENKAIVSCSCGSLNVLARETAFEEKQKKKPHRSSEVLHDNSAEDLSGFPHKCRKCGHGFAEVKEMGIFYGDEAGVYLFKCKKCGYTERQADGTGN